MNFKETIATASRYGVFGGAILSAYFLILYLFNVTYVGMLIGTLTFLLQFIVAIYFSVIAVKSQRLKMPNESIPYLQAAFIIFITFATTLLLYTATSLLILYVVDPQYLEYNKMVMKELLLSYGDKISDEMRDPAKIDQQFALKNQLNGLYFTVILSIVVGFIIALFVRKKPRIPQSL